MHVSDVHARVHVHVCADTCAFVSKCLHPCQLCKRVRMCRCARACVRICAQHACVPVCRYGRNWLKLRALSLTQYDSVLLIDSDVAVVGNVTPLLSLPVEFAASWDQSRWLGK